MLCLPALLGQVPQPNASAVNLHELQTLDWLKAERLSGGERISALRSLVKEGQEDVAAQALCYLVSVKDPCVSEMAAQLIPRVTIATNTGILLIRGLTEQNSLFLSEVSRLTLRNKRGFTSQFDSSERASAEAWGDAALILADSANPADRRLISESCTQRKASMRCLIALCAVGVQGSDADKAIEGMLNDPAKPEEVRLIAEAILSNRGRAGLAEFVRKMDIFLTQFGARDGILLVTGSGQVPLEGKITNRERCLFAVLGVLRFMNGKEVEELTFRHMTSRSAWQNRTLGMIAAKRWPERLLSVSSSAD